VQNAITSGKASTIALEGSTEKAQLHADDPKHVAPVEGGSRWIRTRTITVLRS
jgi:hypothetical protein